MTSKDHQSTKISLKNNPQPKLYVSMIDQFKYWTMFCDKFPQFKKKNHDKYCEQFNFNTDKLINV